MADLFSPLRAEALRGIPHGFFGRESDSEADRPFEAEREAVLPGADFAMLRQTHSPQAIIVERAWNHEERPEGDALATKVPGLLLGIVTADCAPVLLADAENGVIGAAHAGWKGALYGVTDAAIVAMERLGANRAKIRAAIGPCIAQANYEVGDDFGNAFLTADRRNARFFRQGKPGKVHFDLEGYLMARLVQAGIAIVEASHTDTYADEARFYSYRRDTHRDVVCHGRQVSLIGLSPD
ncbi:peptidoglycan editing factor PgeF [Pseudoblastomonas halimionae]|uniref:Purine nucleoside phosphorylase n=1 Tax=Alteriqipengyuania halimionae TaxID=1926630 RepID=A0A6I4U9N3_9SPHN|nr:peptidoglycan editing factor PgeF [Alteriqipengyuania halimionae]MXP10967.1 peptidoglycan editing factor PgeF [Alteriqipengyuania halimionae]